MLVRAKLRSRRVTPSLCQRNRCLALVSILAISCSAAPFIGHEEQDIHTKRAIEGATPPSRFRDVASLEPETMPRPRCHREFLGHAYGEGIGIYAFDVCTEPACEIPSDAATATAKIREFGFSTWMQALRNKFDIVDSGLRLRQF